MESHKYTPFESPQKVGWFLADLFDRYRCLEPDSFLFKELEDITELEVRGMDSTREKIEFSVSSELLDAIHSSKTAPASESNQLPGDGSFDGFIEEAVHDAQEKFPVTETQV